MRFFNLPQVYWDFAEFGLADWLQIPPIPYLSSHCRHRNYLNEQHFRTRHYHHATGDYNLVVIATASIAGLSHDDDAGIL
jgi:hypothetical protein